MQPAYVRINTVQTGTNSFCFQYFVFNLFLLEMQIFSQQLFEKETPAQVFPVNFENILRIPCKRTLCKQKTLRRPPHGIEVEIICLPRLY